MPEPSIWANATVSAIVGGASGGIISLIGLYLMDGRNRYALASGSFSARLEDLVVDGAEYWLKAGQDGALEKRIKEHLERVDLRMQSLKKFSKGKKAMPLLEQNLDRLSDSLTGGEFEGRDRPIQRVRVSRIRTAVKEMQDLL